MALWSIKVFTLVIGQRSFHDQSGSPRPFSAPHLGSLWWDQIGRIGLVQVLQIVQDDSLKSTTLPAAGDGNSAIIAICGELTHAFIYRSIDRSIKCIPCFTKARGVSIVLMSQLFTPPRLTMMKNPYYSQSEHVKVLMLHATSFSGILGAPKSFFEL